PHNGKEGSSPFVAESWRWCLSAASGVICLILLTGFPAVAADYRIVDGALHDAERSQQFVSFEAHFIRTTADGIIFQRPNQNPPGLNLPEIRGNYVLVRGFPKTKAFAPDELVRIRAVSRKETTEIGG